MPDPQKSVKPIINCHTHIFTGHHVPPFLAKTFLWWPFYRILTTRLIMRFFRFWYKNEKYSPHFYKHKSWYKKTQRFLYSYRSWVKRHILANILANMINMLLTIHALLYLMLALFSRMGGATSDIKKVVLQIAQWLTEHQLLFFYDNRIIKLCVIFFTFICIRWGRNLIWLVLKNTWKFMAILPDRSTLGFLKRYVNIGRFANYKGSDDIFSRLNKQYDDGSGFVLLPMDMEFMDAGELQPGNLYRNQMNELAKIKRNHPTTAFPFVFVDPRRITKEPDFLKLDYNKEEGTVNLQECFIKEFIEDKQFNGFKIYPALGYYPFDSRLLILWKYAADHGIPVLTHAIRGNIYYRGTKQKEWGYHPVFKQSNGKGNFDDSLLLPELKNIDFINNFTHPLNFLCLVEEELLRKVVAISSNDVKDFFGYKDAGTVLRHNLKKLKICFGHYGGEDEWEKYWEADRNNNAAKLITENDKGINFLYNENKQPIPGKIEQVWKTADWYSVITSMMLQYPNLYADISYILHDEKIIPLLKRTLEQSHLQKRVLYGTDFYVVRNHKSEKQMLAEIRATLSEYEFDLIARENPVEFLNTI